MLRKIFFKLKKQQGSSPITSLVVLTVCILLFAFAFWIYSLYTVSTNIHTTFERAIRTVATFNEVQVYDNLRENYLDISTEDFEKLITVEELKSEVCAELGLVEKGGYLVKESSDGYNYRIGNVDVTYEYDTATNMLIFVATGEIDIPMSSIGGDFTNLTVDMKVKSMYASKLRADK